MALHRLIYVVIIRQCNVRTHWSIRLSFVKPSCDYGELAMNWERSFYCNVIFRPAEEFLRTSARGPQGSLWLRRGPRAARGDGAEGRGKEDHKDVPSRYFY